MMRNLSYIFLLLIANCSANQFTGSGSKQPDPEPIESQAIPSPSPLPAQPLPSISSQPIPSISGANVEFKLTCEQFRNYQQVNLSVPCAPNQSTTVKVSGQICPEQTDQLAVVFIIDWSTSMGAGTMGGQGNDPLNGSSCGRLDASRAINDALAAQIAASPNSKVQVGMVPFHDSVPSDSVISLRPPSQFAASLTPTQFCKAEGATNYEAAFNSAYTMLQGVTGRKVVYFISDGQPTVPILVAIDNGIAAGKKLHSLNSLTVNAILVGKDSGLGVAKDIMTQIAGDPARVKLVTEASGMASQITQFPETTLNTNTASVVLSTISSSDKTLQFRTFTKTAPGIYTYELEPFVLSPSDPSTKHSLKFSVLDSNGGKNNATINMEQVIK